MNYLHWDEKVVTNFTSENITKMYANGYVFTRLGKGIMQQTRSVRINLSKFNLTSENRRILKKVNTDKEVGAGEKIDCLELNVVTLPFSGYGFRIGKLAKDFYEIKFGKGIMSANKIKEMATDDTKSNFNMLLSYEANSKPDNSIKPVDSISFTGFAICYSNTEILHYSFPFYDLTSAPKDMGLAMMIKAIKYAQESGKKYIYLGSLQRPSDTYKLQFEGLEWFDGKAWQNNIESVKKILTSAKM